MDIHNIQRTRRGNIELRHVQSMPEIVKYRWCDDADREYCYVIAFLDFNGNIKGVGTRLCELSAEEYEILKHLVLSIDFCDDDSTYGINKAIKSAWENVKHAAECALACCEEEDDFVMISQYDLSQLRDGLKAIEQINALYGR